MKSTIKQSIVIVILFVLSMIISPKVDELYKAYNFIPGLILQWSFPFIFGFLCAYMFHEGKFEFHFQKYNFILMILLIVVTFIIYFNIIPSYYASGFIIYLWILIGFIFFRSLFK